MGQVLRLSKEEAAEAFDDGNPVKTYEWRWGVRKDVVFERGGKHFMMTVEIHSQDGLQLYDGIEAYEARSREVTKTVWERV